MLNQNQNQTQLNSNQEEQVPLSYPKSNTNDPNPNSLSQQNSNVNQIENQYQSPDQFYNEFNNNPSINNFNNNYIQEPIMTPDIDELICDQKQFIDDDYLLQLHQRLAQTREQRKISENGVKILNGRVRCLKEENQKTLAKINLTSKTNNMH